MRDWNLTTKDPISLVLTADPRLSKLDRAGSDIWELSMGDSSQPYLGLKTTFGLRAIGMRIFLGFSNASNHILDPSAFFRQPVLTNFSSSYANLTCEPLVDFSVSTEFWNAGSHLVCGRITLTNPGKEYRNINVLVSATLIPASPGKPCSLMNRGLHTCIKGETGGIFPTLVMSGGPTGVASPYPALTLPLRLKPEETRSIMWSCASEEDPDLSLEYALSALKRDWEKELARLELIHDATTLEIHSGDQDWDAVFAFSQHHAFSSLALGDESSIIGFMPYLCPDNTYAQNSAWNNTLPSCLLLNHLLGALLPGDPVNAKKLVSNICLQIPTGKSPSPPRNSSLPFPVLADLVWNITDLTRDQGMLESFYPMMRELVISWFDQEHDHDQDGLPEFQSVDQLGFYFPHVYDQVVMPAFNPGFKFVESPALAALLIRELVALEKMADSMGDDQASAIFRDHIQQLKEQLRSMFHVKRRCFGYRDRDTHITHSSNAIMHMECLKDQHVDICLDPPQRIVVNLIVPQSKLSTITVTLVGKDQAGEDVSESLTFRQSYSSSASHPLVSEQVFSTLTNIQTSSEDPSISLELKTMELTTPDISCLLPTSSELISTTRLQSILNAYFQADKPRYQFGLPEILSLPRSMESDFPDVINLSWNFLLLEILLDNTLISEAVDLFSRLMTLVASSLKHAHAFFEYFDAKDGYPKGHRHSLSGIVPISLYLRMIGVRIVSPTAVEISGECPFSGEIKVKYRGMQVIRDGKLTRVILPNGQVTRIYGTETHLISQKKG